MDHFKGTEDRNRKKLRFLFSCMNKKSVYEILYNFNYEKKFKTNVYDAFFYFANLLTRSFCSFFLTGFKSLHFFACVLAK